MENQRKPNPYQESLTNFNGLASRPFSVEAYASAIDDVQLIGMQTKQKPEELLTELVGLSGTALGRARSEKNEEAALELERKQKGFQSLLNRYQELQNPRPSAPRGRSGVSSG